MKKTLITGSTGMVGSSFVERLQDRGEEVCGIARPSAASRMHESFDYEVRRVDMLDYQATRGTILDLKPDVVIHMAAQAFNGTSWSLESYTHLCNFNSTLNLLNACREEVPECKILLACSSAEYGCIEPEECPLVEDRPLKPVTPYGVSKMSTEALGFQYFSNYGMRIYLPRMFIHVGTGHPPATAIQNFAKQIAEISMGLTEPVIEVGRLDTARDFIDVRDGVEAMLLLLKSGNAGEPTNICTGESWKIGEVLELLCEIAGVEPEIRTVDRLLRPSDERLLLGDPSKIESLGWNRKYSMKETLKAVYLDWCKRLKQS